MTIILYNNNEVTINKNGEITWRIKNDKTNDLLDLIIELMIKNGLIINKLFEVIDNSPRENLLSQKLHNYFSMLMDSNEYRNSMINNSSVEFVNHISELANNSKQIKELLLLLFTNDFNNEKYIHIGYSIGSDTGYGFDLNTIDELKNLCNFCLF